MSDEVLKVLLIEDDEEDYLIARRILARPSIGRFELVWASTLTEGLARLGPGIDAVLLDLSLPDSQGWDTFARVQDQAPGAAIILLTGLDDGDLGMRAIQQGAQDYVVKGEQEAHVLCRAILFGVERKRIKDRLQQVVSELRQHNAQMAADLRVAREVQLALLPQSYPAFPPSAGAGGSRIRFSHFYHPCRAVGGDFFTILPVSDLAAGVFLCDVMGHGMRSALVTAILRGLLEELRSTAQDPGQLLTRANRAFAAILRQPHAPLFASAVYLLVDLQNGVLAGANAGHPPPVRLARSGCAAETLAFTGRSFGPALGIDDRCEYTACRWDLAPGERLLLYTDGLVELADEAGRQYGPERLLAAAARDGAASLESLLRAIMLDAGSFCGRGEPADDICLVGVQTGGEP